MAGGGEEGPRLGIAKGGRPALALPGRPDHPQPPQHEQLDWMVGALNLLGQAPNPPRPQSLPRRVAH